MNLNYGSVSCLHSKEEEAPHSNNPTSFSRVGSLQHAAVFFWMMCGVDCSRTTAAQSSAADQNYGGRRVRQQSVSSGIKTGASLVRVRTKHKRLCMLIEV